MTQKEFDKEKELLAKLRELNELLESFNKNENSQSDKEESSLISSKIEERIPRK